MKYTSSVSTGKHMNSKQNWSISHAFFIEEKGCLNVCCKRMTSWHIQVFFCKWNYIFAQVTHFCLSFLYVFMYKACRGMGKISPWWLDSNDVTTILFPWMSVTSLRFSLLFLLFLLLKCKCVISQKSTNRHKELEFLTILDS